MKLLHRCGNCGCEIYEDDGKLIVKTRGFIMCGLCYEKLRQLQREAASRR